ncbi:MAG: divergent polysaccharide deacetylase family protein [Treponema sp.]|jgi:polysaccharide deacetylase 2 family uncharacterized protein YibQ|nr:divergent polysaccharide deacetylase family protein [Treponema sp.]
MALSRVEKARRPRKPRKKLAFEDAVRAALVAAAVICAAVLGAGGFFAVRSVLASPSLPPPALDAGDGETDGAAPAVPPEAYPGDAGGNTDGGTGILPELEEAIRQLDSGTTPPVPPPAAPPVMPAERKGVLVFVIDDAGNNLRELEPFLAFPGPLTIAVLPALPNSAEAARRIRAAGKEAFLHQPMEPLGAQDPGPGAIKTGMTPAEVKAVLDKNLDEIGPVTGVNNHEGSRATMDREIMKALLEGIHARRLVFLDSRTIADTAGPAAAKELGLDIAQRDIFLDNEQDRDSIIKMINEGMKKAQSSGVAIMIGHTWSPHLAEILTRLYPSFVKEGYYLATVGAILDAGK